MVISTSVNKIIYSGDSVTSTFPVNFPFFVASDLVVSLKNTATGVITPLVLTTNYTVSITNANNLPSVGSVTLTGANSPLATGYQLIILRTLPLTQQINFIENQSTPAATYEEGYDRSVMLAQQLKEEVDRTLLQAVTSSTSLTIPTPITGYFLQAVSATVLGWVSAITSVTYAGTITRGIDASKSATPGVGDIYIATDTGRMYVANSINVWSQISFTANGLTLDVSQAAHGLAINDVVLYSGGLYAKARGNTEANSRAVGVVSAVASANAFTITLGGYVTTLSGLSAGAQYWLSEATAGLLTTTKPTTAGNIVKPVLVALSATTAFVQILNGIEVTASAGTDYPTGYLYGGVIGNNSTDPTNDFDFTACKCRDAGDTANIVSAAMTKRIDATWVVGTAQGMLDTGTIGAVADIIYLFAIDDSTAVLPGDFLASKSRTAPTMPAGYDVKRLIGHRRWTGSAWELFSSSGLGLDRCIRLWTGRALLSAGSATAFTDVDCSAFVDGNVARLIDINATISKSTVAAVALHIRPNGATEAIGAANYFHEAHDDQGGPGNPSGASRGLVEIDTTSIYEYANSSASAASSHYLRGYFETL